MGTAQRRVPVSARVRIRNAVGLHAGPRNLSDPSGEVAARLNAVPREGYARLRLDGRVGVWQRWNHIDALAFSPRDDEAKAAFRDAKANHVEQWVEIAFIEVVQQPPAMARATKKQPSTAKRHEGPRTIVPAVAVRDVFAGWRRTESREERARLFDGYAFADYRGGRSDGPGVVLCVALGDGPPRQVTEVRNRATLDASWRALLRDATTVGARMCFGQDHQYGIPIAIAAELGIPTSDWRTGIRQLFDGAQGDAARAGKAGEFALTVNEALLRAGRVPYFWSATKTGYGLPSRPPRGSGSELFRLTELGQGFPFARLGDNGSVGGQTIVGLPRVLDLVAWAKEEHVRVSVWPFDGLRAEDYATGHHIMIEPYPSLVRAEGVIQSDLNDALASTIWAQSMDRRGVLAYELDLSAVPISSLDRVRFEGWIAGVPAPRSP